jgi:hypothetical protein
MVCFPGSVNCLIPRERHARAQNIQESGRRHVATVPVPAQPLSTLKNKAGKGWCLCALCATMTVAKGKMSPIRDGHPGPGVQFNLAMFAPARIPAMQLDGLLQCARLQSGSRPLQKQEASKCCADYGADQLCAWRVWTMLSLAQLFWRGLYVDVTADGLSGRCSPPVRQGGGDVGLSAAAYYKRASELSRGRVIHCPA